MRKYLLKNKGLLFFTTILRTIESLFQLFSAILIQNLLDSAMNKDMNGLVRLIVLGVIYFALGSLVEYLRMNTQFKYIKKTLVYIKNNIFESLINRSVKDFKKNNTSDYISVLTNDITLLETKYIVPIIELIGNIVLFIGTVITLFYINPIVALTMMLATALLFLIPPLLGKVSEKRQQEFSNSMSNFTNKIKDLFLGYEVIKNYSAYKKANKEYTKCNIDMENAKYNSSNVQAASQSLSSFFGVMTQILAIGVSGYFLIKGQMTVGTIFAIVQLGNGLYMPIISIVRNVTLIKSMKSINENIISTIDENLNNKQVKINKEKFTSDLKLKNIHFSYDGSNNILEDISINFEKGKKYALVGASGSGKSTILKLIKGYYDNYKGEILINNTEYKDLNEEYISENIAMINQDVYMFDNTLKENILLEDEFSSEDFDKAINQSGINEFIDKLPNNLDSYLGENGSSLSGGQKQRISIARALIRNTPILLLDESTSALDFKTAYDIEKSILNLEDVTVITVTHKLQDELLDIYDEIIVIDKGQVVEQGSMQELKEKEEVFYKLINSNKINNN